MKNYKTYHIACLLHSTIIATNTDEAIKRFIIDNVKEATGKDRVTKESLLETLGLHLDILEEK